ncbi:hypothetical protein VKS41_004873 [Umbelopsis sp. WA50703]
MKNGKKPIATSLLFTFIVNLCNLAAAIDIGPGTRSGHCAFTYQNSLFIYGGSVIGDEHVPDNHTSFSQFSSLNFPLQPNATQLNWKDIPSNQSFNVVNGACAITDSGYAIILGYDPATSSSPSPGLQIFNTNGQTWINSIRLNGTVNYTQAYGQRQGMASAMWSGKVLYTFGGALLQNSTQDMFALDTRTWPWTLSQIGPSDNTPSASINSTMIATTQYLYLFDSLDTPDDNGDYQTTVSVFDTSQQDWLSNTRSISTSYPVSVVASNASTIFLIPKNGNASVALAQLDDFLQVDSLSKRQSNAIDNNAIDSTNTSSAVLTFNPNSVHHSSYQPTPIPGSSLTASQGGTITNVLNRDFVLYGGKSNNVVNKQLVVYDTMSRNITNSLANVGPQSNPTQHVPDTGSSPADSASPRKLDRNLIGLCIALAVAGLTALAVLALLLARRRRMNQEKQPSREASAEDDTLAPITPDFRRFSLLKEHDDAVTWSDKVRSLLIGVGSAPNDLLRKQSQRSKSAKLADSYYRRKDDLSKDMMNSSFLQVSSPIMAPKYTENQIYSNLAPPAPSRFREHFDEKSRVGSGFSASAISADEVLLRNNSSHLGFDTSSYTQEHSIARSISESKGLSIPGTIPATTCGGVYSDTTITVPPSYRRSW